ncbi:hypothetical protein BY996DRAFT_7742200 [Phakopsora pachyrhizi]|nr:hypothetical protein BY996DRAFT_7742200 [Phakopsora pachyrhizi]
MCFSFLLLSFINSSYCFSLLSFDHLYCFFLCCSRNCFSNISDSVNHISRLIRIASLPSGCELSAKMFTISGGICEALA